MENLLTVAFEAHSQEENHHRRDEITVGRDLLDDWTVSICYGPAGQGGREIRFASSKPDEWLRRHTRSATSPPIRAETDRMRIPLDDAQFSAGV